MIILYAIGILFILAGLYLFVKAFVMIFKGIYRAIFWDKIKLKENPYINAQKLIDDNNREYEDYLKWMSENSSGVPLKKVMTKEEYEAEIRIKKLIS